MHESKHLEHLSSEEAIIQRQGSIIMSQPLLSGNLEDLPFLALLPTSFDDAMANAISMRGSPDWDL